MAQTTLTLYAGDQLYRPVDLFFVVPPFLTIEWHSYVTRLAGTFIGLIVGLLVWYIGGCHYRFLSLRSNAIHSGNAHSNGSAYGTAASFGVFLVPLMFIRLFAPQQYLQGVILLEVCHCLLFIKSLNPKSLNPN